MSKKGYKQSVEHKKKISIALTGKKASLVTRKKMSMRMKKNPLKYWLGKKRLDMTDEKHWQWKGEKVGYESLHLWIKHKLGTPSCCEHCGTKKALKFEWANKDHKYRRNLEDWIRLCTSCHRFYDYRFNDTNPHKK